MHLNYFTIRALAAEWNEAWAQSRIVDAYSQSKGEISLVLQREGRVCTIRCRLAGSFRYIFRTNGASRARRNVVSVFESIHGSEIAAVTSAERDRHIFVHIRDERTLHFMLFGPRSNVFLLEQAQVRDAFRNRDRVMGDPPVASKPAAEVGDLDEFRSQWRDDQRSAVDALKRAVPLFDRDLAGEVLDRARVDAAATRHVTEGELARIWACGREMEGDLGSPQPRLYTRPGELPVFSLLPLRAYRAWSEEPFDTVDAAIAVFVRRTLGALASEQRIEPLRLALRRDLQRQAASLAAMRRQLESGSRADEYERSGHLLMAHASSISEGLERVELKDLFQPDTSVVISLDPTLSVVQNAEKYYDRARRVRLARRHAERRMARTELRASDLERANRELEDVDDAQALAAFEKRHADLIRVPNAGQGPEGVIPFRRFHPAKGYEIWVGRNARQNDDLTFRKASKHDLWLHARGVSGSHVVLRLPGRDITPPRHVVEMAAQIAAHFSSAAGSDLVPVIVTQRKYVRKMKGGPPGAVVVEREEVVIVPPVLPEEDS